MAWRDMRDITKDITWQPKKPREKEFEHIGHGFQSTYGRPNTYSIHPDWISEELKKPGAFGPRRYRPWSYEFKGARNWPLGTGDVQMIEERLPKSEEDDLYKSDTPQEDAHQWIANARNRLCLRVVDTKQPFWRPNGKPWSGSYQTPFPTYATQAPVPPGDKSSPGKLANPSALPDIEIPARPYTAMGTGADSGGWPSWAQGCSPGEVSFRIGCLDHPGYPSTGSNGRQWMNFANAQWISYM